MSEEDKTKVEKQIEEEYKILQSKWDDFDRRTIGFKGWIAAGALVFLTYAGKDGGQGSQNAATLWFGLLIVASIWLLEAIWKSWHHAYGNRIVQIEEYFRSDRSETLNPFQIVQSWDASYRTTGTNYCLALKELFTLRTAIPYLPVMMAILFFIFHQKLPELLSCAPAS